MLEFTKLKYAYGFATPSDLRLQNDMDSFGKCYWTKSKRSTLPLTWQMHGLLLSVIAALPHRCVRH